jgi:hypothetical protein
VRKARREVVLGSILYVNDGFGGSIADLRGSFDASEPSSVASLVQCWVVILKHAEVSSALFGSSALALDPAQKLP